MSTDTDPAELKRIAGKPALTTGDAAKLCGMSDGTILKWLNAGMLKGYLVPGTTHRRVLPAVMVAFMKEHGLPLGPFAAAEGKAT